MWVVGIVPGLRSLAYSAFEREGRLVRVLAADVLHVRGQDLTSSQEVLNRKARVHDLVLGVVMERGALACVGVGPPYDRREPRSHVDASRRVLDTMALRARVPLLSCETDADLYRALGEAIGDPVRPRDLRSAVESYLREPLASRNRKLWLATAAGIVAMEELMRQQRAGLAPELE